MAKRRDRFVVGEHLKYIEGKEPCETICALTLKQVPRAVKEFVKSERVRVWKLVDVTDKMTR